MPREWFILKVGTQREEKVRRALLARVEAQGLDEVVPCTVVVRERRTEVREGQRRTVLRTVYPGYVMVEIETDACGAVPLAVWHLVRETPGCFGFVGAPDAPDRPKPMSAAEVETLRHRVEALAAPEREPIAIDLAPGERVRVREGAFTGLEGTVGQVHADKGTVTLEVMVFGRATPIDLELWKVEK